MRTFTSGEDTLWLEFIVPSKYHFGEDRHEYIKKHEIQHAKRVLYEQASDVFKVIHAAFLDTQDISSAQEKEVGQERHRMEYRVRGELW